MRSPLSYLGGKSRLASTIIKEIPPDHRCIEHLDALDCIRRYDRKETFFYIDPPYYDTAGYAVPFGHQDYLDLAVVLSSIKGRFILSLNDHKKVREIFSDFRIRTVKLRYSSGNSRTASKTRSVDRSEVLIRNF